MQQLTGPPHLSHGHCHKNAINMWKVSRPDFSHIYRACYIYRRRWTCNRALPSFSSLLSRLHYAPSVLCFHCYSIAVSWLTNNAQYLGNGWGYEKSYYYSLIGSCIWAFHWYQNYCARRPISSCGAKGGEARLTVACLPNCLLRDIALKT